MALIHHASLGFARERSSQASKADPESHDHGRDTSRDASKDTAKDKRDR